MKWQKLGLLWTTHHQRTWMHSHSAVPVAQHRKGNIFRVYSGIRNESNQSQIGWFEFDITQIGEILDISVEPVLGPGRLGTFDDSGVTPSCLISQGKQLLFFYTGWSLGVTVPFYFTVGLALSNDDGQSFQRASEAPLLERTAVDPLLVASPEILIDENGWHMWYVSGLRWQPVQGQGPRHYYHIRYAHSKDGLIWKRSGKVCIDFASEDEYAFSRPTVIKDNGIFRMWYSFRGNAYRLGYAESIDGLEWIRKDEEAGLEPSAEGWDAEMICYPYVFRHQDKLYLLYNGNDYGKSGIGLAMLTGAQ